MTCQFHSAEPEQSSPAVSVSAVNVYLSGNVSQTTTDFTFSCELRKKSRFLDYHVKHELHESMSDD